MPGYRSVLRPMRDFSHPRLRGQSRGFTLIELTIVAVLIGILAALSYTVIVGIRQRNAISLAPKQLMAAMAAARSEATLNAEEVVFVLIGNTGPAAASQCGRTLFPSQDTQCVRYWILRDNPPVRFNATSLT